MARLFVALLCAIPVVLGCGPETAEQGQGQHCQQAQDRFENSHRRNQHTIWASDKAALNEVTRASLEDKLDDPRGARDSLINRDPHISTRGQRLIVRQMKVAYCKIIFSHADWSDEEKLARYTKVAKEVSEAKPYSPLRIFKRRGGQASWPKEQDRRDRRRGSIVKASFSASNALLLAADESVAESEFEFLADAPYYVNATNKYFVIVGSPTSEEEGVRLVNRLQSKAPQYDFALYPKYKTNPHLALMMATWVSKEVADKALKLACRDVVGDAYTWCYPDGSCFSTCP